MLGGNPFIEFWDEDDDEEEDQYGDMKKASVQTLELMEEIADSLDDQNRLTSRNQNNKSSDRILRKVHDLSNQINDLKAVCDAQNKTIETLIENLKK